MSVKSGEHFRFFVPPVVEFGRGSRGKIPYYGKKLGLTRVLLLLDPYVLDTVYFEEIKKALEEEGISTAIWHGVVPNPTDVSVDEAVEVYRQKGCEGIVSIGGGSALDTAKGVAIVDRSSAKRMREHTPPAWKPVETMAPMILVPTTSGTGAEVNPWAMITNTETGKKVVGYDASELVEAQRVAIVDPDLTASMPPELTAVTGMDAFCHALECYLCDSPNPVSDIVAFRAIELVAMSLRRAVYNGKDMDARTEMSLASVLATTAFPNADLTYPHRLSAQLYDRWGMAHGITVAVTLRATLELLAPFKSDRMARVAEAFGVSAAQLSERERAEKGIEEIARLMKDIGIPTFKEASGASAKDVDAFIDELRTDASLPKVVGDRYEWVLKRSLEL